MGWQDDPIVAPAPAAAPPASDAFAARSWRADPIVGPATHAVQQQALEDERISREGPYDLGGFARQAAQGLSFGLADEGEAKLRSLAGSGSYDENLTRIRQENEDFARRNPEASIAGQIGGAIPTALFAPEVRAARALGYAATPAKGLFGQSLRSGVTGGAYGGAYGFGSGEGGFANRGESAGEGAKLGLGLGLATPAALRAANLVTSPMRDFGGALANRTMGTVDQDTVITALRRDGYTPEQALAKYQEIVENGQLGPNSTAEVPYALADLGQNTQRLAQSITSEPGAAQTIGNDFLGARSTGDRANPAATSMYDRLNDYLRRAFRTKTMDYGKTLDTIQGEQKALSDVAYDQARNTGKTINVDDILEQSRLGDIELTPSQQALMNHARAQFSGNVNLAPSVYGAQIPARVTDLSVARFDNGKRALDDMIKSALKGGNNNEARLLGEFQKALIARADTTVPEYAAARSVFRSREELLNAADLGRQFMKGDSEITAKMFGDMSPGEQQMFRIGTARQVRQMLGSRAYGEDMTRLFRKPNVQEVLDIAFPKNTKNYNPQAQFYNLTDAEQAMQKTYNMAYRGSDTSRIQAGQKDFGNMSIFGRALRQIGTPEGALWVTITEGLQHLTRMREADAVRTARLLFNSDPATIERTLNMLQTRYGSDVAYKMRRLIEPRMRAVPGTTGAVGALQASQQQ